MIAGRLSSSPGSKVAGENERQVDLKEPPFSRLHSVGIYQTQSMCQVFIMQHLVLMISLGDELKRDGNHLSLVLIPMPATGKDSQYIFVE